MIEMEVSMGDEKRPLLQIIKHRAPVTVIGVIVLSLIGTILYDLAVKPGLSSAGRLFLGIMTLGSQTLRDAAYAEAALDPTPVTPLILLVALMIVLLFPIIYLVSSFLAPKTRTSRDIDRLEKDLERATQDEMGAIQERVKALRRRLRRQKAYLITGMVIAVVVLNVLFAVHNQSVLIWRAFHADLALLRPYITSDQYYELCARFSAMNKRSDYLTLRKVMDDVANRYNVRLHDIKVW
jgi:hypothetical protein